LSAVKIFLEYNIEKPIEGNQQASRVEEMSKALKFSAAGEVQDIRDGVAIVAAEQFQSGQFFAPIDTSPRSSGFGAAIIEST
jgi:hypothetical protein